MGFSEDSLHIDRVVCLLINYPRDVITGSLPGFLMGFKEKNKNAHLDPFSLTGFK